MMTNIASSSNFKIKDSYPTVQEKAIGNERDLRKALKRALQDGPRVVILDSSDAGSLTIGIGTPYGFVQFVKKNNLPPYLVAIDESIEDVSFVEFDAGGTLTPVPRRNCLEFNTVIEIAEYFYKNKKLPEYINWEEV